MSDHTKNTAIVYRRASVGLPVITEYLWSIGRTADTCRWSQDERYALRMPPSKAAALARKFNKGIDAQARVKKPYGWEVTNAYYPTLDSR